MGKYSDDEIEIMINMVDSPIDRNGQTYYGFEVYEGRKLKYSNSYRANNLEDAKKKLKNGLHNLAVGKEYKNGKKVR